MVSSITEIRQLGHLLVVQELKWNTAHFLLAMFGCTELTEVKNGDNLFLSLK